MHQSMWYVSSHQLVSVTDRVFDLSSALCRRTDQNVGTQVLVDIRNSDGVSESSARLENDKKTTDTIWKNVNQSTDVVWFVHVLPIREAWRQPRFQSWRCWAEYPLRCQATRTQRHAGCCFLSWSSERKLWRQQNHLHWRQHSTGVWRKNLILSNASKA